MVERKQKNITEMLREINLLITVDAKKLESNYIEDFTLVVLYCHVTSRCPHRTIARSI